MKKLIYSMLALLCVALTFTSCGGEDISNEKAGKGTIGNPYSPIEAVYAVQGLKWKSNTDYDKTDDVYIKGKISRIASGGTFTEGGIFGNASFFISADGSQNNEFHCFRVLYLGNKKYETAQTDISVGDEVIICGKLMNYKENTPQTVSNEAYLVSLVKGTKGTKEDPYSPTEAINAVQGLKWKSNTDYDMTDDVYIKGKISRIASGGTFTEGGIFGNASFFISADGSQNNEFFCFRILYLGNKKYETGLTDIRVGDDVVVCGKLMNYKENTPETVPNEAYLFSLVSNSATFDTNSSLNWTSNTDGTYGSGYSATTQGLKVGYYKHTSSTNAVTPNVSYIRIYKNSVLSIATTNGRKMKKIVMSCQSDYCHDMQGLEGSTTAVANTSTNTITWSGSASKVVLYATTNQVRVEKITVEFE